MGMLRVFLVLASAAMLGGCEEEIPLSTETTRAGEGAIELRVVNSFIDEMEITIAACQQTARIEANSTAVIECLLRDTSTPFEVEIAWPGSPLNAQGGSSFPPQIALVVPGQIVRIGIAPEGVEGGFTIRVAAQ